MTIVSNFESFGQENEWPGVVVDVNDPQKTGRIRVNVPRFFGTLEVEDIPWASQTYSSSGREFVKMDVGKVVNLSFPNGDIYHPEWSFAEHYNINLKNKLDTLTEEAYIQFQALVFDANFQFYEESTTEGMVLDYVKSKFQINPDGDMILNLRDNSSTMYLGSNDADQSAMLGNRFINWFDDFIKNMIGNFGGPYLGNLSAPVIANPAMLQICNQYFSIRSAPAAHFLSDRVKLVDNDAVNPNQRQFDLTPEGDEYMNNDEENTIQRDRTYQPSGSPTSTGSSARL